MDFQGAFLDDDLGGLGIRGFGLDLLLGDAFGAEDGDEGEEAGETVETEMNHETADLRVDALLETALQALRGVQLVAVPVDLTLSPSLNLGLVPLGIQQLCHGGRGYGCDQSHNNEHAEGGFGQDTCLVTNVLQYCQYARY